MNMIERIARAIHDAMYSDEQSGAWMSGKCPLDSVTVDGDVDLMRAATAAIQAMREPTKQMMDAAQLDPQDDPMVSRGMAYSAWVSMIDAAAIDTGAGEG